MKFLQERLYLDCFDYGNSGWNRFTLGNWNIATNFLWNSFAIGQLLVFTLFLWYFCANFVVDILTLLLGNLFITIFSVMYIV